MDLTITDNTFSVSIKDKNGDERTKPWREVSYSSGKLISQVNRKQKTQPL